MSLATWKAFFYPKDANATMPEEALAHSLLKWQGLRPDRLKAHGLRISGIVNGITDLPDDVSQRSTDENTLRVNGETCALCVHHWGKDEGLTDCGTCPLAMSREDGVPCTRQTQEEEDDERPSPYDAFCANDDPEPMITALEAAITFQNKR